MLGFPSIQKPKSWHAGASFGSNSEEKAIFPRLEGREFRV
jgi:hypothetical protein